MTESLSDPLLVAEGRVDVVYLSGPDRLAHVQRLSTNRLEGLAVGEGRGTVLLHDDGRVVDLLACYQGAQATVLLGSGPGSGPAVAAHLQRYRLYGDDLRITDASEQVRVFELFGPGAARVGIEALAASGEQDASGGAWRIAGEGLDERWGLAPIADTTAADYMLVCPADQAASLREWLGARGVTPASASVPTAARVRAGLPAHGAEIGATRANPLELALRPLIDFDKGCYIGQEVVARLDSYDRVQRMLVRLRSRSPLEAGMELLSDAGVPVRRAPGVITSASRTDEGWIALGLAPLHMLEAGGLALAQSAADSDAQNANEPGAAAAGLDGRLDTKLLDTKLEVERVDESRASTV